MTTIKAQPSDLLAYPCLTIRQPWASLIFSAGKDVENRVWETDYRGPLFVHAGQRRPTRAERADALAFARLPADFDFDALPYGMVIGLVDVVDCVAHHKSRWFCGPFGLVLARPRLLDRPLPLSGRLGLFRLGQRDLAP